MNTQKIVDIIEIFAPKDLACSWDNTGWQVNLGNSSTNKVLLCLTCTENIIKQGILGEYDLIISHHPLIFDKLSSVSPENTVSKVIITAIQNNIQIYSAHTNLDAAENGVSFQLAKKLSLQNIRIPAISSEERNLIRIGEFSSPKTIAETVNLIKESLNLNYINLINNKNIEKISKVAVVSGSGASLIPLVKDVDLFVTGDVKYHQAIESQDFVVADAGHYHTEVIVLETLKELLSNNGIESVIADEPLPWETL